MRSKKKKPAVLVLDLPSERAAKAVAEKLADRTGWTVRVTNEDGERVHEEAPPRRNEIIVRPKTVN